MSKLLRPAICAPCVFCLVLGALYFLGSTGDQALAGKSSKGGLPEVIERVETLEEAMRMVFADLDSQAMLFNAVNFDLNARLDDLEARVSVLEGGSIP